MKMSKAYKVQIIVKKTMTVTEDEFNRDNSIGIEFNERNAIMYAKGVLIEELRNNPNRGTSKVIQTHSKKTKNDGYKK